jgi:hypothetical protein
LGIGDETQEILGYGIIKRNDGVCKESGYGMRLMRGSELEPALDQIGNGPHSMVDGGMTRVT